MTKSIKELFDEYKEEPRGDWIPQYKARVEQVEAIKNISANEIDDVLLKELWLTKANGIASVGQGIMYRKEYEELLEDFIVFKH